MNTNEPTGDENDLNDAERAMLDNVSTLKRLAVIQEAVAFELDLQVKRKEELERARDNLEEEIAHVETIVVALEGAADGLKDTVTEIEAAEQADETE